VDIALLLLGINCGFGNMDIGTLKRVDVDLEAAIVSHSRSKTGVMRQLVLWPQTISVLKQYLKHHRGTPSKKQYEDLFFIGKRGHPLCWERIDPDGKFRRSDAIKNRFVRLYKKSVRQARCKIPGHYQQVFFESKHMKSRQICGHSRSERHRTNQKRRGWFALEKYFGYFYPSPDMVNSLSVYQRTNVRGTLIYD
jgi:hypothetical protein